jgi:hypothetical protein
MMVDRDYTGAMSLLLTQGKHTLIDAEDYERVVRRKWQYYLKGYARSGSVIDPVWLHRYLLDAPPMTKVDHINGNGLDNRKMNLRICSHAENQRNRKAFGGTSSYKGVSWDSKSKRWRAQIRIGNRNLSLGRFIREEEAALAYNATAMRELGAFAWLNVILASPGTDQRAFIRDCYTAATPLKLPEPLPQGEPSALRLPVAAPAVSGASPESPDGAGSERRKESI